MVWQMRRTAIVQQVTSVPRCVARSIITTAIARLPSSYINHIAIRSPNGHRSLSSTVPAKPTTAAATPVTTSTTTSPSPPTPSSSRSDHHRASARESFWATLCAILGGSTAYLAYRLSTQDVDRSAAPSTAATEKVKLPPPKVSGVVHESEAPWVTMADYILPNTPADMFSMSNTKDGQGAEFQFRKRPLSYMAGGDKIGTSLYEVMPGKTAFPYHYHTMNEEAIYILDGIGMVRIGDNNIPVHRGSYIAMPVGQAHAHQLWNTSESETLRYLCYSTNTFPEITVYPDSGKIGAQDGPSKLFSWFYARDAVPFFAGEGGASATNLTATPAHANGPSAIVHAAEKAKSSGSSSSSSSTPAATTSNNSTNNTGATTSSDNKK